MQSKPSRKWLRPFQFRKIVSDLNKPFRDLLEKENEEMEKESKEVYDNESQQRKINTDTPKNDEKHPIRKTSLQNTRIPKTLVPQKSTWCRKSRKITPGVLLLSSSEGLPHIFEKSVILLLTGLKDGVIGLILNKKGKWSQLSLPEDHVEAFGDSALTVGGPIVNGINIPFFVVTRKKDLEGFSPLPLGLSWGSSDEIFQKLIQELESGDASSDDYWFFIGYSGWAKGQLEGEILRGD